MGWKWSI